MRLKLPLVGPGRALDHALVGIKKQDMVVHLVTYLRLGELLQYGGGLHQFGWDPPTGTKGLGSPQLQLGPLPHKAIRRPNFVCQLVQQRGGRVPMAALQQHRCPIEQELCPGLAGTPVGRQPSAGARYVIDSSQKQCSRAHPRQELGGGGVGNRGPPPPPLGNHRPPERLPSIPTGGGGLLLLLPLLRPQHPERLPNLRVQLQIQEHRMAPGAAV
mmetsp:Transcript_16471/g.45939  ORF Transcript_16471/g.45939 Transcript_16471/m.45939 type:complete len:215 (+) Transcript_16471:2611-3255(+)